MKKLLEIKNLCMRISRENKHILEDINLTIHEASTFGLIGQSGSGKTMCVKSILKLHKNHTEFSITGQILFKQKNLLNISEPEMCKIRGNEIAYICQKPYEFV